MPRGSRPAVRFPNQQRGVGRGIPRPSQRMPITTTNRPRFTPRPTRGLSATRGPPPAQVRPTPRFPCFKPPTSPKPSAGHSWLVEEYESGRLVKRYPWLALPPNFQTITHDIVWCIECNCRVNFVDDSSLKVHDQLYIHKKKKQEEEASSSKAIAHVSDSAHPTGGAGAAPSANVTRQNLSQSLGPRMPKQSTVRPGVPTSNRASSVLFRPPRPQAPGDQTTYVSTLEPRIPKQTFLRAMRPNVPPTLRAATRQVRPLRPAPASQPRLPQPRLIRFPGPKGQLRPQLRPNLSFPASIIQRPQRQVSKAVSINILEDGAAYESEADYGTTCDYDETTGYDTASCDYPASSTDYPTSLADYDALSADYDASSADYGQSVVDCDTSAAYDAKGAYEVVEDYDMEDSNDDVYHQMMQDQFVSLMSEMTALIDSSSTEAGTAAAAISGGRRRPRHIDDSIDPKKPLGYKVNMEEMMQNFMDLTYDFDPYSLSEFRPNVDKLLSGQRPKRNKRQALEENYEEGDFIESASDVRPPPGPRPEHKLYQQDDESVQLEILPAKAARTIEGSALHDLDFNDLHSVLQEKLATIVDPESDPSLPPKPRVPSDRPFLPRQYQLPPLQSSDEVDYSLPHRREVARLPSQPRYEVPLPPNRSTHPPPPTLPLSRPPLGPCTRTPAPPPPGRYPPPSSHPPPGRYPPPPSHPPPGRYPPPPSSARLPPSPPPHYVQHPPRPPPHRSYGQFAPPPLPPPRPPHYPEPELYSHSGPTRYPPRLPHYPHNLYSDPHGRPLPSRRYAPDQRPDQRPIAVAPGDYPPPPTHPDGPTRPEQHQKDLMDGQQSSRAEDFLRDAFNKLYNQRQRRPNPNSQVQDLDEKYGTSVDSKPPERAQEETSAVPVPKDSKVSLATAPAPKDSKISPAGTSLKRSLPADYPDFWASLDVAASPGNVPGDGPRPKRSADSPVGKASKAKTAKPSEPSAAAPTEPATELSNVSKVPFSTLLQARVDANRLLQLLPDKHLDDMTADEQEQHRAALEYNKYARNPLVWMKDMNLVKARPRYICWVCPRNRSVVLVPDAHEKNRRHKQAWLNRSIVNSDFFLSLHSWLVPYKVTVTGKPIWWCRVCERQLDCGYSASSLKLHGDSKAHMQNMKGYENTLEDAPKVDDIETVEMADARDEVLKQKFRESFKKEALRDVIDMDKNASDDETRGNNDQDSSKLSSIVSEKPTSSTGEDSTFTSPFLAAMAAAASERASVSAEAEGTSLVADVERISRYMPPGAISEKEQDDKQGGGSLIADNTLDHQLRSEYLDDQRGPQGAPPVQDVETKLLGDDSKQRRTEDTSSEDKYIEDLGRYQLELIQRQLQDHNELSRRRTSLYQRLPSTSADQYTSHSNMPGSSRLPKEDIKREPDDVAAEYFRDDITSSNNTASSGATYRYQDDSALVDSLDNDDDDISYDVKREQALLEEKYLSTRDESDNRPSRHPPALGFYY